MLDAAIVSPGLGRRSTRKTRSALAEPTTISGLVEGPVACAATRTDKRRAGLRWLCVHLEALGLGRMLQGVCIASWFKSCNAWDPSCDPGGCAKQKMSRGKGPAEIESFITAPNGLKYHDLEVGSGPKAWSGALIKCQ